jgi:hypothetical protein
MDRRQLSWSEGAGDFVGIGRERRNAFDRAIVSAGLFAEAPQLS